MTTIKDIMKHYLVNREAGMDWHKAYTCRAPTVHYLIPPSTQQPKALSDGIGIGTEALKERYRLRGCKIQRSRTFGGTSGLWSSLATLASEDTPTDGELSSEHLSTFSVLIDGITDAHIIFSKRFDSIPWEQEPRIWIHPTRLDSILTRLDSHANPTSID